jgi:pimeloyl-ACP methyl ester carboxylesterase
MPLLITTTILGISYGTTLGATVASMFPDRIDKMVLDGVQNPHEYYNGVA